MIHRNVFSGLDHLLAQADEVSRDTLLFGLQPVQSYQYTLLRQDDAAQHFGKGVLIDPVALSHCGSPAG